MGSNQRQVFLTGATGYMGTALAKELLRRGHVVRALVRSGSEAKAPAGCEVVVGDALHADSYASRVAPSDTFVHLVGVAHPNPRKGAEFRAIDLQSIREAVSAAAQARVRHFVYLSVARPAPMMHEYQAVRAEGEQLIRDRGLSATFVRPWYVLGPGHRWPTVLIPLYAIARQIPQTRDGAIRLGLVTLEQMTRTLVWAIESPTEGTRILEPPQIKRGFGESEVVSRRAASA